MEDKHFFLLAIYLALFVVPALMPGWRSLGAVAVATMLFAFWLFTFEMNRTGGFAHTLEVILYALALTGAAVGVVTRALTLSLRRAGLPRWVTPAVTMLGASLPVVSLLLGADYFF